MRCHAPRGTGFLPALEDGASAGVPGDFPTAPVVAGGAVYATSTSETAYALSAVTGATLVSRHSG